MEKINLSDIGLRIRRQREFLKITREELAEMLSVTPKFCSDIELGVKGMSLQTLCNVSGALRLSTDYILKGFEGNGGIDAISLMIASCPSGKQKGAEELLKVYLRY